MKFDLEPPLNSAVPPYESVTPESAPTAPVDLAALAISAAAYDAPAAPKPLEPQAIERGYETRAVRKRNKGGSMDSMGLYLNEIGKHSLLTAEEEKTLGKTVQDLKPTIDAIKQRDPSIRLTAAERKAKHDYEYASERFTTANLRLVVSVARRYPLPQSMDLGDLIQEGNLGLMHAVEKFDWQRGFKFSTYSTFWIRQAIGRALDQKASAIRLPGDRSSSLRAALRQGDPLDGNNAEMHRLTTPTSLDKSIGEDGDTTLGDMISNGDPTPEERVVSKIDTELVKELLESLDSRARYAVEAYYGFIDGEHKSFREIGENLGVTAEAARRLTNRALNYLHADAIKIFSE